MGSLRIMAAVLAAAWVLPGGAAAPAPAAFSSANACTALTAGEASSILGIRVQPGQHVLPEALSTCSWAEPGDASIDAKKLVLTVLSERAFDSGKTPVKGVTKVAVPHLGEEAYYISTPPFGTALSVKQGTRCFQVRISGYPGAQAMHLEKTVALKLLRRG
jgi:hypothetical protein